MSFVFQLPNGISSCNRFIWFQTKMDCCCWMAKWRAWKGKLYLKHRGPVLLVWYIITCRSSFCLFVILSVHKQYILRTNSNERQSFAVTLHLKYLKLFQYCSLTSKIGRALDKTARFLGAVQSYSYEWNDEELKQKLRTLKSIPPAEVVVCFFLLYEFKPHVELRILPGRCSTTWRRKIDTNLYNSVLN